MHRWVSFSLVLLLALVLPLGLLAQEKKAGDRITGRVHMINKDKSEITVATRNNVQRVVVFGADTKFEYGHSKSSKASTLDQVKEGNYIMCGGKFEGVKLVASRCIFREQK